MTSLFKFILFSAAGIFTRYAVYSSKRSAYMATKSSCWSLLSIETSQLSLQ